MSPNELDNFLRQKEREFDVPFEEKYWEQARELIDRERGYRRVAWWQNANVRVAALVVLLGSIAGWYALTNNHSTQNEIPVATTNERVEATPYFESNDNTAAAGSGKGVSTEINNSDNTASASVATSSNDNPETTSENKRPGGNTSTAPSDNATASDKEKRVGGNASDNVNSNSVKTTSSIDNKTVTIANNVSKASNTVTTSSGKINPALVKSVETDNAGIGMIRNLKPFIHYRVDHEIPVFEEMTPNDPTLLKFYGLYYKSEGSASRKIRDFKRGAQYPQLGFAAAGGVNVFNQIKHRGDTNIYLGVNPYVGFKACYQWNPVMMISLQPMLMQRGGIHFHAPADTAATTLTSTRHLYYLQIPATLGFKVSKKNTLYGGGGVSVLLASGYNTLDAETEKIEGKYKIGENTAFNTVDYFVTLGYQFRMNKNISFQGALNYGFIDITKNTVDNAQTHNNLHATFGLTYQLYQEKLQLRK